MAEIYFLGTGGSVATPLRDNTSLLLRYQEDLVLVDCPGSLTAKIGRLSFSPSRVSSILLTHIHPDHVYGLPSFIHSLMLEEGEIQLWGSAETIAFSRRLLDLFELRQPSIKTRVRFRTLRPGQKARLGKPLRLKALGLSHHSSSLAYHFYLEEEGKEFLFSGDTPPSAQLFEEARGIDCLIHEASAPARYFEQYPILHRMHTSSLELGEWARKAEVRCLVPCHFLGEVEFSPDEIREEIRRHFGGRMIIPRDLQEFRL